MRSPLQSLSSGTAVALFLVLLVAFLAISVAMAPSERTMRAAGHSIVQFELAGPDGVRRVLSDWGDAGRAAARSNVRWDFAWLVCYAVGLALLWAGAASRLDDAPRLATAAVLLSWAALLAGALDAVENVALLAVLDGRSIDAAARLAQVAATLKFALVVPVLLGLPVAAIALRRGRRRTPTQEVHAA